MFSAKNPSQAIYLPLCLPDLLLFFFYFYCHSITVVCLFSPSLHPTPAEPPSLPHLHPPPWYCLCVLYSSSCNSLSKWVDQKTMVYLHNGILRSREKEGAYTLCNSMDRTGEHYAKWNKPDGEGQIPYDLTFNWNLINRRKKQTKYNQRHWSEESRFASFTKASQIRHLSKEKGLSSRPSEVL